MLRIGFLGIRSGIILPYIRLELVGSEFSVTSVVGVLSVVLALFII